MNCYSGACDTSSLLVISCMFVCLKLVQVKSSFKLCYQVLVITSKFEKQYKERAVSHLK